MIIKTKKYKLPINTYIQLGLKNIFREQWWVFLIALAILSGTFFIKTIWFAIGATVGLMLYTLFWFIQFYGITQLEQNQLIFERLSYELTSKQIIAQINPKQGMPIAWEQIKRVKRDKDAFLLILSKTHLVYLPDKIFNSSHEVKFVETILKRKGLLK
jgi:hypothetical protein